MHARTQLHTPQISITHPETLEVLQQLGVEHDDFKWGIQDVLVMEGEQGLLEHDLPEWVELKGARVVADDQGRGRGLVAAEVRCAPTFN